MSEQRSIFITGASSGLGRDAALRLAESEPADPPLRLPVGEDSRMASTPINEAQEQAQKAIMAHFGWESRLQDAIPTL